MRRAALVVALAVLLAAPGCSRSADGGEQPLAGRQDSGTAVPEQRVLLEGVSAQAVYGRHAAVRGKVDVRITNTGPAGVEVESYQVRHPLFTTLPATDRTSSLPPDGRERLVPVPFGGPRCDRPSTRADGQLHLVVRREGRSEEVVVPLRDGRPGLSEEHARACAVQAATDAAEVSLGGPWALQEPAAAGDRPALRASLVVRSRQDHAVTVDGMTGSILFGVRAGDEGPPVLQVQPGSRDAVDTQFHVARCDDHALVESKTSFRFTVFLVVDGAEPVPVPLEAPQEGRRALQDLLDRTCGAR